ncbi:MAG: hypothetical protein ACOYKE_04040 [Ferruginibacter sp.]
MQYKDTSLVVMLFILLSIGVFSCKNNTQNRSIEPAFYYWKSAYNTTNFEHQSLQQLNVKTILIKYFDVDWDAASLQPIPVAKINFKQTPDSSIQVIPVVFITNGCIQNIAANQSSILANKIVQLIDAINALQPQLKLANEIQIDCDWTASTRERYFSLLQQIKQQINGKQLSVTIRLHQIKFIQNTGIPPADKGLLMCYNMGNLKNPATENSIIETDELKKYTGNLSAYPLPLDVAFPLFEWKVLFRQNTYKGLMEDLNDAALNDTRYFKKIGNRYEVLQDTVLAGYALQKNDKIRDEKSGIETILSSAQHLQSKLKNTPLRVCLYHLDSLTLSKYTSHELETIFRSLQ